MKILLAVDGSIHSDEALESVLARPWPEGSKVKAVSIAEPMNKSLDKMLVGGLGDMAERAQAALVDDLKSSLKESTAKLEAKFGASNVESEFQEGNPREIIVQLASKWGADLIALGSCGASAAKDDSWLGGVARAVTLQAPCTVEVLQPTAGETDQSVTQWLFLVAVNTEQNARAISEAILSRPWPEGSKFKVITVIQSLDQVSHSRLFKTKEFENLAAKSHEGARAQAEALVSQVVSGLQGKLGSQAVEGFVLEGNARSTILQTAQDWPADMIIMGADDGDSKIMGKIFGSTAAAVLSHASCSVQLVKLATVAAR